MAIFPHLELEDTVQVNDRTRLSAAKSYVTQDNAAIDKVEIRAGSSGSYIEVYDNDTDIELTDEDWYLDWEFTQVADITSVNNKIDFAENGVELIATLTTGTYATLALLAAEVQTQLNSVGSFTYTVTVSQSKVTIAADGAFELLPTGDSRLVSILPVLGFTKNTSQASSVTGEYVEYLPVQVTVRITDDSAGTASESRIINVFSIDGDHLFSSDADLRKKEPDILKYLEKGRNTFLNIHRRAQHEIMEWLDKEGYVDLSGNKFDKRDLIDIEEVHAWSVHVVLRLIFDGLSNAVDDVFWKKARYYESMEKEWRDRAVLRIDADGDGEITPVDQVDIRSAVVVRR